MSVTQVSGSSVAGSGSDPVFPFKPPFQVSSQSMLLQDMIGAQDLLAQAGGPQTFALYDNPFTGQPEAAVVVNGSYNTLKRDSSEPGGYRLVEHSGGALEVAAARTPDGKVFVFLTGAAQTVAYEITSEGPSAGWHSGYEVTGLQVSYLPGGTNPEPRVTYTVPGGGGLLYALQYGGGTWTPAYGSPYYWVQAPSISESPAGYAVGWQSDGYGLTLAVTGSNGIGWLFSASFGHVVPSGVPLAAYTVNQLTGPLYEPGGQIDWVFIDNSGYLTLYRGGSLSLIASSINFSPGVLVPDSHGLAHIYLTTQTEQGAPRDLYVIHQTGFDSNGPTWANAAKQSTPPGGDPVITNSNAIAVPVRAHVAEVQADSYPTDKPTLVILTTDVKQALKEADNGPRQLPGAGDPSLMPVRLLSQNTSSGNWLLDPLRQSSTVYYSLPRWRTDLAFTDANGTPLMQTPVNLSATETCLVEVAGQFLLLEPGTQTPLTTDPAGKLAIAVPAYDLTAPLLLVSADGLAQTQINPSAPVHDYLKGTGQLPDKPHFDAGTLESATVNGSPLVDWANTTTTSTQAVGMMNQIISLPGAIEPHPVTTPPSPAGFRLTRTSPDAAVTYQEFLTPEELTAHREALRQLPNYTGSIESWWDEIEEFAGDVWEGIKSGAAAIADLTVDVAKKSVHLVLQIGKELVDLGTFIINTATDAFNAVMGVFSILGTAIQDVIDWLKDLFNWADIWNTKSAFQALFKEAPAAVGSLLDRIESMLDHDWFDWLRSNIGTTFDSLASEYSTKTFSMINQQADTTIPPEVAAAQNNSKTKWMMDRILGSSIPDATFTGGPLQTELAEAFAGNSALDDLLSAFEHGSEAFSEALAGLSAWINQAIGENENGESVALGHFVAAMKDLAFATVDLLQGLADAAFSLARTVLQGLEGFLFAELEWGPLNSLYRWVQEIANIPDDERDDLSIAGLACLLMAIPMTIAWKAMYGEQPFPGGKFPVYSTAAGPGGTEKTVNNLCAVWAGLCFVAMGVLDIICDIVENYVAEVILIAISWMSFIPTWPSEPVLPLDPVAIDWKGPGVGWVVAHYITSMGVPLVDTAMLISPARMLSRWFEPGKGLDCAIGLLGLFMGAMETAFAHEKWTQGTFNIMSHLTPFAQPLRMETVQEATYDISLVVKILMDLVGDWSAGAFRVGGWLETD